MSPNTTLAHYTIVSKIGVGGRGEVYRPRDTRLDKKPINRAHRWVVIGSLIQLARLSL
jgi:serine/threonine protein kinase